jgi:ankyrin repeat protein
MEFQSLEDAVFNSRSLADPAEYVMGTHRPDELFSDRQGREIALLHYMIMVKSKPGVELLVDIGADPNVRTSEGETPLGVAVIVGSMEMVQTLVEKGANINLPSREGNTPLHMALSAGKQEIADYLLSQGAETDIPNDLGITAQQLRWYNWMRS